MLNPVLYSALGHAFGTVEVENEGESADIELTGNRQYPTEWRIMKDGRSGEQYRVNCPVCGDYKQHLYISYLSYARPVMAGLSLMQGRLLCHCFRRNCMAEAENRRLVERMIGAGMACVGDVDSLGAEINMCCESRPKYTPTDQKPTLEGMRSWIPGFNWCDENTDPDIVEYLSQRGVTQDMVDEFMVGWGPVVTPRTKTLLTGGAPWVLLPVVMNGMLVGMQARCPDKFIISKDSLRYWNHPGMRKKTMVYNIDSARDCDTAVLCEGIFDVMKVGHPGVCCFGHTPSRTQLTMLSSIGKCLIWLPDTDSHEDFDTVQEARTQAAAWNAMQTFELGAHVVVLPEKDAGSMSRHDIWTVIMDQVPETVGDYLVSRVVPRLRSI